MFKILLLKDTSSILASWEIKYTQPWPIVDQHTNFCISDPIFKSLQQPFLLYIWFQSFYTFFFSGTFNHEPYLYTLFFSRPFKSRLYVSASFLSAKEWELILGTIEERFFFYLAKNRDWINLANHWRCSLMSSIVFNLASRVESNSMFQVTSTGQARQRFTTWYVWMDRSSHLCTNLANVANKPPKWPRGRRDGKKRSPAWNLTTATHISPPKIQPVWQWHAPSSSDAS